MPRIEDIDQFNRSLIAIANEPNVLAARGEQIEVPTAEALRSVQDDEAPAPDFNDLLSDLGLGDEEAAEDESVEADESSSDGIDFSDDLAPAGDLNEEEVAGDGGDFDLESFDFDTQDYSGPESGNETSDEAGLTEFPSSDEPSAEGAFSEELEPSGDEEPAIFGEAEVVPESVLPEEPAVPENLFDLESQPFDFGDFDTAPGTADSGDSESGVSVTEEDEFAAPVQGSVGTQPRAGTLTADEPPDLSTATAEEFEGFEAPEDFETPVPFGEESDFGSELGESAETDTKDFEDLESSPVTDDAFGESATGEPAELEEPSAEESESAGFDFDDFGGFDTEPETPGESPFEAEELAADEGIPESGQAAGTTGPGPDPGDEFSFDLEEDELGGLDMSSLEPPETATAEEEEFSAPVTDDEAGDDEEAFALPDESELARQAAAGGKAEAELEGADDDDLGGDLEVDEFNLGDFGAEFGVGAEDEATDLEEAEEDLNPAVGIAGSPGAAPAGIPELRLTDKDFENLKRTLSYLPLNLKISVEEIVGDAKGTPEQFQKIVQMLIDGGSPTAIASLASDILGKTIRVPRNYQKRTGVDFEAERRSFAYQFRENILPILRLFIAGVVALGILVFVGYRFVYRPLHAQSLYRQGYEQIGRDSYRRANELFGQATAINRVTEWYFRYASAFAAKHQYQLAEQKYDAILSFDPWNKRARLTYADFESKTMANYQKAANLLKEYTLRQGNDFDVILATGDNYMRWADEDKSHLEDARLQFAFLLQHFGPSDPVYLRMLQYFIRADNEEEVLRLEKYFQNDPKKRIDPAVFAELGGYLMDKNEVTDVKAVLTRALKTDREMPQVHYQLARYYGRVNDAIDEERALTNARNLFAHSEPLSDPRLISEYIDTFGRLGKYYYDRGEFLTAEQQLTDGINKYEAVLKAELISPKPEFGELYSTLGNIHYYQAHDYARARADFQNAIKNGYDTNDLRYKLGYIDYQDTNLSGNYELALENFTKAAAPFSKNQNLLYATANAFYQNRDYFSAEGYYLNLLSMLSAERASIKNLDLQKNLDHKSLIEMLVRVENNLGVTLDKLSQRTGNGDLFSRGLVELKNSTEDATDLARSAQTNVPPATVDLAYLNLRGLLYPQSGFAPQIYPDLPIDMTTRPF